MYLQNPFFTGYLLTPYNIVLQGSYFGKCLLKHNVMIFNSHIAKLKPICFLLFVLIFASFYMTQKSFTETDLFFLIFASDTLILLKNRLLISKC